MLNQINMFNQRSMKLMILNSTSTCSVPLNLFGILQLKLLTFHP